MERQNKKQIWKVMERQKRERKKEREQSVMVSK